MSIPHATMRPTHREEAIPVAPPAVPAQIRTDDEPTRMSPDEWSQAVQRALSELGMTYEQLAEEARQRDFRSARARRLWVIIGGPRP